MAGSGFHNGNAEARIANLAPSTSVPEPNPALYWLATLAAGALRLRKARAC